jgi:formylglycine-generating enzyme required for sulfatase activity
LPFAVWSPAASLRQARGAVACSLLVASVFGLASCDHSERLTGKLPPATAALTLPSPAATPEAAAPRDDRVALASLREVNPPEPEGPSACPANMVLVEGSYCPKVQLNCKQYMDPKGRYEEFRCAEYGPSRCLSKERRPMRFCIDRTEFTEPGETLPANHRSFTHGEKACAAQGKRMCRESEWNFACEGEQMRPYPYGFSRDSSACNADRLDVVSPEGKLRDLRAPGGSFGRCASPFGVMDMAGNLEEFVAMDRQGPPQPAMKGAYWQPSRNFCRAAQTAHDRYYNGTETGFRCCSDAE